LLEDEEKFLKIFDKYFAHTVDYSIIGRFSYFPTYFRPPVLYIDGDQDDF